MPGYIITEGDNVMFMPTFGAAIVVVKPGQMKGTGQTTIGGKKICVAGDESKVEVAQCIYNAPPFVGGKGTLKIKKLNGNQKAKNTKSGGKKVIVEGSLFDAVFEVQTPAKAPGQPPQSDPMKEYNGKGMFVTKNTLFKAK